MFNQNEHEVLRNGGHKYSEIATLLTAFCQDIFIENVDTYLRSSNNLKILKRFCAGTTSHLNLNIFFCHESNDNKVNEMYIDGTVEALSLP